MKIKAHHVKMARAAWRVCTCWPSGKHQKFKIARSVSRWHRAAKGKHQ